MGDDDGAEAQPLSPRRPRNERIVDAWSFVHLGSCALLALLFGPLLAFVLALLWEPIEVLALSPILARLGVDFGHETLQNSLSDIAFNSAGVLLGALVLSLLGWSAPFSTF